MFKIRFFIHMDPITIYEAPNVFLEKCSNTEKQPIKAYLLAKNAIFVEKCVVFLGNGICSQ